jgi:hypothetical protein
MFVTHARWIAPLGALMALASCSLINAFDEVAELGSSSSGGLGGAGTGGGTGTGGGGGDVVQADPGLVVVGGKADDTVDVLVALSPQTGEELARLEGTYSAAVHEAQRDVWFLIQGTEARAAKFNRRSNEWEYEGGAQTVTEVADPLHVFALNGYLAILDGSFKLQVFDTSDLGSFEPKGEADYPTGLWGAVGTPTSAGGEVHTISLSCPGAPDFCDVLLARIQIDASDVQQFPPATIVDDVDTMEVGSEQGSIAFNPTSNSVVAVVPGIGAAVTDVFLTSRSHTAIDSLTLTQYTAQPRLAAVDPCQSVVYVLGPLNQTMVAKALSSSADNTEMNKAIGITGQGLVYEPYTRSLILQQQSGNFTIDAWSIVGTETAPDLRKRLGGSWAPPTVRPTFLSVANPRSPLCE